MYYLSLSYLIVSIVRFYILLYDQNTLFFLARLSYSAHTLSTTNTSYVHTIISNSRSASLFIHINHSPSNTIISHRTGRPTSEMCTRSTKRQRGSKSSLPQPHNVEHLRRRLSNHDGGDENGRRLDSSRLDISDDGHRAIDGNCSGHILTALPKHIMSAILFGYLDRSPKQLTRIRSE